MHDPESRLVKAPFTLAQMRLIAGALEHRCIALRMATVGEMSEVERAARWNEHDATDLVRRMALIFIERHKNEVENGENV